MNLAIFENRAVADMLLDVVTCVPPLLSHSTWDKVRIEARKNPSSLSGVRFVDCTFRRSYFGNAKLNMSGATFERCRFISVTWMFGQMKGVTFRECELRDCQLRSADLTEATFDDSVLASVNLEKARLQGARFRGTELLRMQDWGWHGYEGADISDEQKFKYFITNDPAVRIREALNTGEIDLSEGDLAPFLSALEARGFAQGEVMLIHSEWSDTLSFGQFVAVGKLLQQRGG